MKTTEIEKRKLASTIHSMNMTYSLLMTQIIKEFEIFNKIIILTQGK